MEEAKEKQMTKNSLPSENISTWIAIEVLTEVIKENGAETEPLKIAARLSLRGVAISFNQVKEVLDFYEVKKTPPTRP